MNKEKLLLVEDDVNFGFVLKSYLEMNEFDVDLVSDGKDALPSFNKNTYDLCILDVMLPNVDGFTIAKEIRKINKTIPIIFLTAKSLKDDVLEGFKSGADDYLTKPFDSEVLLAKIKVIIRRNTNQFAQELSEKITIGKYVFNTQLRTLQHQDTVHKLTPRESDLLQELYLYRNNVLDRNQALKKIWGDDNYFNARSMDVYITKLRKYFKDSDKIQINNIHGSGFILVIKDE
ncbi:MAG: response regulator transcription factor [Bacteroidales bacterium]|jgi:DNA-binding response OmpR family regulator|nr:response regulator transcription factor [Bacteroidales bacterium]MCK9499721.1 response regulator transcription factor [Bacteroidales bacterium]MDY0314420.1 response regulator transcription factor [Bacteroidales bacterium]NLB86734.1 response regulator transcription factor [Bacteroidales bacterium]